MVNNRDELIRRYKSGERSFRGLEIDSEMMDLKGVNLSGCDFSESFIIADFREANLENCLFESANVKTCDFRNSNLRNASFLNAAIDGAEFENANLENTNFEGAGSYGYTLKKGEKP